MAFQALKNSCEISFRPIKKFDDLAVGTYLVDSFSMKNTEYGKRIFVNIGEFCVVLPPRFMERINKCKQIDELNAGRFKMVYNGKDRSKKDLLLLNFIEIEETDNDDTDNTFGDDGASTSKRSADEADGASLKRVVDDDDDDDDSADEPPKKTQRKRTPKKFF